MSNDDEKKNGKTDFSKFRISANSSGLPVAQKILMHVPVGKPSKQRYVRVHSDNKYRLECAILKLEDDERPYLIAPHIASAVAQDIKLVILQLSIDKQGNVFLWPVPPVPEEGNDNSWNQSQREIATMAENQWVRISSNRAVACYEPLVPIVEIPEPTWPTLSLDEILNIAFGSTHIIDNREHPALLKLWGAD
jgi:hypothetical protein